MKLVAAAIREWLQKVGVQTLYIAPGSPWENAYIKSFHSRLRDELLNAEVFGNLREAHEHTPATDAIIRLE